ncbi:MAG: SDR family oxidoreductase [Lentisphaerae bacterium]|nr:SDR family oxidoreductase [Lentisphaerota bacterium]
MRNNSYGRIINLGSISGEVGLPGYCAYSAAKAAVIMLSKTMAMELASCGITVNCVSPGMITDAKQPHAGTWLGRTGIGDEVARAITFLASDGSGYITGVDFPVDGGRILGPKGLDWKTPKKP